MPEYRITVDALDSTTGEGGLESLSFFASSAHDIFAGIGTLHSSTAAPATQQSSPSA